MPNQWNEAKRHLNRILDAQPGERNQMLAALDPSLRVEVESLLLTAEDEGFSAYLERPAVVLAERVDPKRSSGTAGAPDFFVGRVLDGKYHIEQLLGQGGMGAVYRAVHTGTGRAVAVKIIHAEFARNAEFLERFRREARAAGRLRHPNVVYVTDFGVTTEHGETTAYLVMELLEGESLRSVIARKKRLPMDFIADTLGQIAAAVDAAHDVGILHRDLKPDNIWLVPDGRGTFLVKVLDFGLARFHTESSGAQLPGNALPKPASAMPHATAWTTMQMGESDSEITARESEADEGEADTHRLDDGLEEATYVRTPQGLDATTVAYELTRLGTILGTPAYMSPEQCSRRTLTPASDIYSLGVVAYELLSGKPPFSGDMSQLLVLHAEAPPPSLLRTRPDMSRELDRLIASVLAKNVSERPPSAGAFASAFRVLAQGEAALALDAAETMGVRPSSQTRAQLFTMLPFLAVGCLLIHLLIQGGSLDLARFANWYWLLWIVPLGVFALAVDAVSVVARVEKSETVDSSSGKKPAPLRRVLRRVLTLGATSVAASTFPSAVLSAHIAIERGSGWRAAVADSRRLLAPFRSIARGLWLRRLQACLWPMLITIGTYEVKLQGLGNPAAAYIACVLAAGIAVSVYWPRIAGMQSVLFNTALAYDEHTSKATRRALVAMAPSGVFRIRRTHLPRLVASLLLGVLALSVLHVVFVPLPQRIDAAPRPRIERVPDDENAWVEYHRAIEAAGYQTTTESEAERRISSLKRISESMASRERMVDSLRDYALGKTATLDDAQRTFLLDRQAVLDHMMVGVKRPSAQFTAEAPTFDTPVPSLIGCRAVVSLALARSRMLVDEGRTAEGVELLLAAYEMSTDLSEPSTGFVGILFADVGRFLAQRTALFWISQGALQAPAEIMLARRMAELDSRLMRPETIMGNEYSYYVRSYEDSAALGANQPGEFAGVPHSLLAHAPGLTSRIHAAVFRRYLARKSLAPLWARWDLVGLSRVYRDEADGGSAPWFPSLDVGDVFVGMNGGPDELALYSAFKFMYRERAFAASVEAMLLADAFRQQRGRFPDTLAEASSWAGLNVPVDVATGAPIGYRIENGAPVVWAAGDNGIDDGGRLAESLDDPFENGCDFILRFGERVDEGFSFRP